MVTVSQSRWVPKAITAVVWAAAAGSVLYWGLRLSAGRGAAAAMPPAVVSASIDPQALGRVLGVMPAQAIPQASLSSRFALQGVVAGAPGGGAALIAIDGNPAKPYRVGSPVEDGLILQSASARQAKLAASPDGPILVTLEMPVLKN